MPIIWQLPVEGCTSKDACITTIWSLAIVAECNPMVFLWPLIKRQLWQNKQNYDFLSGQLSSQKVNCFTIKSRLCSWQVGRDKQQGFEKVETFRLRFDYTVAKKHLKYFIHIKTDKNPHVLEMGTATDRASVFANWYPTSTNTPIIEHTRVW